MSQATKIVKKRIGQLEEDIERAETQYNDPECPHCDREIDVGSMEAGKIRWGCYPPLGKARSEYDCPYFQEAGTAYTMERTIRDVEPLRRCKLELERVLRQIERNGEDSG